MDTSSYNIYCPRSRLDHEPHMLNFWFSSCIERQKAASLGKFASLESCRYCAVGKTYLLVYVRCGGTAELFATCQEILMERNLVSAGSCG